MPQDERMMQETEMPPSGEATNPLDILKSLSPEQLKHIMVLLNSMGAKMPVGEGEPGLGNFSGDAEMQRDVPRASGTMSDAIAPIANAINDFDNKAAEGAAPILSAGADMLRSPRDPMFGVKPKLDKFINAQNEGIRKGMENLKGMGQGAGNYAKMGAKEAADYLRRKVESERFPGR